MKKATLSRARFAWNLGWLVLYVAVVAGVVLLGGQA